MSGEHEVGLASGGVPGDVAGRLALRVGEHRFEAEGPVAWVEAMVGQWAQLLAAQAALNAAASQAAEAAPADATPTDAPTPASAEAQAAPEAPEAAPDEEDDGGFRRVPANFRPRVNLDLAAFLALKEATLPMDLVLAAAYYHERYLGMERYTPGQLNEALAEVPAWDCSDAAEQLEIAAMRGWAEAVEDGRWTLTFRGQDHVHHDMAYDHGEG